MEAFCSIGTFDDLDGPVTFSGQGGAELVARIDVVGKDMAQSGEPVSNGFQNIRRTVPVLNVGGMNQYEQHQAECVSDDMALASLDLLARVIAANPAAFGGLHVL